MNIFDRASFDRGIFTRHIDEHRLASFAEQRKSSATAGDSDRARPAFQTPADPIMDVPSAQETAHLASCARCSQLLAGHERVIVLLQGPWSEQRVPVVTGVQRRGAALQPSRGLRGALLPAFQMLGVLVIVGAVGLGLALNGGRNPVGGAPSLPPTPSPIVAHAGLDLSKVPGCLVYSIGPAQGDFKLRIQEPDGDNARTIDHRRMESVPSWSPDGKQLAFLVRTPPDQHDELWISDADGSGAHHVLNRSVSWVSWSPDGKWIAFVDSQDSKNNIAIVRPDGTGLRTLSDFRIATPQDVDLWEHSWGRLTWSPDSRLVATAVSGTPPHYEKHSDIWIWDIETRVHRVISTGSLGAVMDPAWSPDGKTIVFSAREGDGDNDLWRVPADGGRVSQLTTIPGSESQPAWSPDGKHLAFLWDTDSRHRPTDAPRVNSGVGSGDALSDIAVLRLSDGQYAPVTSGVTTLQFPDGPAWCPTGS